MSIEDVERRLGKLEERVESLVNGLNRINQTARDKIIVLEKQFKRLERTSAKLVKATDKRTTEQYIDDAVERALEAYDRSRR